MLSIRDLPQNKRSTQTESEGIEKISHTNGHEKKARIVMLMSDKIDVKPKAIKRDNKGHYIILKGIIQQDDITFVNIGTQHRSTQ